MSDSADKPLSEQASSELGDDDLVIDEFFRGYAGRRLKAAIALITLWLLTAFLHSFIWGNQLVLVATGLIAIHTLRVMLAKPRSAPAPLPTMNSSAALSDSALSSSYPSDSHSADAITTDPERWPYVSLLVAAKNEEHVIGNLVEALLQIDYPATRYDLWFINDNSSDRTAQILDDLSALYPRLNVVHRGPDATGGKSGALNLVWPKTKGDLLAVFDADARVPQDLLRYVVPMFDPQLGGSSKTGAVQVRKAIANASDNFWTRGQKAEMALDCHMQERRIAIGGIGELRGNGQFVRRRAIAQCGGWNEETITDDLDLTIQLHLHQWDIGLLFTPAVDEEGVTAAMPLWHQRNRWAEGGFQRYLDYWRQLAKNRLGWKKSIDMGIFWIIQYMMPAVVLPDFVLALLYRHLPVFGPITILGVAISFWGMWNTLRRAEPTSAWTATVQTLRGTVYMLHWVVVIATMAIRISIRPKRLKWVKTVHGSAAVS